MAWLASLLLACALVGIIIVEVTLLFLLRELRRRRSTEERDKRHCDDPIAHSVSCLDERLRMLDESL
jgi:membrane protein implicated in regulation of membrane protease activity